MEKIKTIGDADMVAAGVPVPHDDHARTICDLALAMQAHLRSQTTRLMVEPWFELEPRGIVELRGRGEMETWFLVGPARA